MKEVKTMPDKEPSKEPSKNHFIINLTFNIGNKEIHFEQRAGGKGQINKDVGTNANEGGQNAINGRSGITGDNNDEVGGQQGIKVRDSDTPLSSNHSESSEDENEFSPLLDEENA